MTRQHPVIGTGDIQDIMDDLDTHTDPHFALDAALQRAFPDPVDLYEDALARSLGLHRHPTCPRDLWRRFRVRFLKQKDIDPTGG